MRRGLVVVVVATAVVALGAGGWFAFLRDGDGGDRGPRAGSVRVAGPPVELAEDAPAAYRVVYRVEDRTDEGLQVTTDRVWVRRPFESRLETWTGEPPGEDQLAVEISAFGRLASGGVNEDRLVTAVPPGVPASDVRIAPMLDAAVDSGVVVRRERREVLGRPCQVYRSSAFFTAARLEPPTRQEYAETCVDADGIALEEVLYLSRHVRHRRVAVNVEVVDRSGRFDDELFGTGDPTVEVRKGGGSVREADPTTRPQGEFWEVRGLELAGLEHAGRHEVIPPQAENFSNPLRSDHIVAGVSDVWVDSERVDFVVVDQGATLRGVEPFQLGEGTPRVDMGELGQGEVLLSSRGNEVRVLLGGGRYLRVYGTLTADRLADIARRLQRTEGTGITYLDDQS